MTTDVLAPVSAPTAVRLLQDLFLAKQYDQGMELVRRWWGRFSTDPDFLAAAQQLQVKTGEMTAALRTGTRLALAGRVKWEALAKSEGRRRELLGGVPELRGPRVPVTPVSSHRILHLVKESRPYLSNGFTSRSHHNFRAEAAAGLDPIVLTEPGFPRTVIGPTSRPSTEVDGIVHHHLDVGSAKAAGLPAHRFLQLFADMALDHVQRLRPAVIHASSGRRGFETALVALALRQRTGIPVVYEVRSFFEANWTDDVAQEASGEIFRARMRMEDHCMREADVVLTLGEAMRDHILGRGVPASKVGIVPNGIDIEQFRPITRDERLAKRIGLGSAPSFGYVSNMDHFRENQEVMIRACASLAQQGYNWHCVLVGDGPRRPQLEALADSLGVSHLVHFTGRVDHTEIAAYYSLIDVFVVPRTRERAATYVTPLKPFEAMALNIPVVVSDLPALTEIAAPPTRGWVFPVDDASALGRVITEVAANEHDRHRRVTAARAWVRDERQWKHNGPRYRRFFEHAMTMRGQ